MKCCNCGNKMNVDPERSNERIRVWICPLCGRGQSEPVKGQNGAS